MNLGMGKLEKNRTMIYRVPQTWLLKIIKMPPKCFAVIPRLIVNIDEKGQCLAFIPYDTIYDKLIESKIKPPTGYVIGSSFLIYQNLTFF